VADGGHDRSEVLGDVGQFDHGCHSARQNWEVVLGEIGLVRLRVLPVRVTVAVGIQVLRFEEVWTT
jgi:hypothetical protein